MQESPRFLCIVTFYGDGMDEKNKLPFPTFLREQLAMQVEKTTRFCCRLSLVVAFLRFRPTGVMPPSLAAHYRGKVRAEAERLLAEDTPIFEVLRPCEGCRHAALVGAYLACGRISVPAESQGAAQATDHKGYHMEWTVQTAARADELCALFFACGAAELPHRTTRRRDGVICYYKKAAAIEEVLFLMGQNKAGFRMINLSEERKIRNNVNRRINCDAVNIRKAIATAEVQIAALSYLVENNLLGSMPPALQETAKLRLAYPSASLAELVGLHEEALTRSGVNHRLAKLVAAADAHRARRDKKDT